MTDNNVMLSKLPYNKDEIAFLQAQIRAFNKLTMMTAPDESDEATVWSDNWNQLTLPKLICIAGKLLEYAASGYHSKNVQGNNQPCQDNVSSTTVTGAGGNKRAKVESTNTENANAEKANTKTNKDYKNKSNIKDYEQNEEEQQGKRHNTPLTPTGNAGNDWNNNYVETDPEEVAMNTSSLQPFTHEEFVEENNYLLGEMEELLITPFTVNRLLELLLNPFAHYTDANGELRGEAIQAALRRCILVSSPAMKSILTL